MEKAEEELSRREMIRDRWLKQESERKRKQEEETERRCVCHLSFPDRQTPVPMDHTRRYPGISRLDTQE